MAVLDLTNRIIQTPPTPMRGPNGSGRWHPWRRALQVVCGILLVALPLTNGLRLDIRRGIFYFAWHKMAAHDLVLLFWISMLGVWCIVTLSFLFGRLWCGWVCPQTLASDFADSLRVRLDKAFRVRKSEASAALIASRAFWILALVAISVGTGLILVCYWIDPHLALRAALRPGTDLPASLTLYGIAALLAADMLWVRRRFCTSVCPYGPLIGLFADKNTLAVRYLDERDDDCIHCGKCVTDCPMDIDIKQGAGQYSCIGCGECADACNDVLGKRGKAGLIEYRYGLAPERATKSLTLWQRWGLWDGARMAVLATCALCLGVVVWLMYGRLPLSAALLANGAITRDSRVVRNTFTLTVNNGAVDARTYRITVAGLPQARIAQPTLTLGPRAERRRSVTITAPSAALTAYSRTPIRLTVSGGGQRVELNTIFFAPAAQTQGH